MGKVAKAQKYVAEGRRWVVDLDPEKFFDRVASGRTTSFGWPLAGRGGVKHPMGTADALRDDNKRRA